VNKACILKPKMSHRSETRERNILGTMKSFRKADRPANGPTNQLRAASARHEAARRGRCRD